MAARVGNVEKPGIGKTPRHRVRVRVRVRVRDRQGVVG